MASIIYYQKQTVNSILILLELRTYERVCYLLYDWYIICKHYLLNLQAERQNNQTT